jgi:alkylhydroperoxidase/carboxymuconolactone decarboxylase family protein YurZ
MVRKEEEQVVKAMKSAKTAEEMVKSWWTQRPGFAIDDMPAGKDPLAFYEERKPEMVFTFAHNQLTQLTERGILDPKTRYLVIIACYMMENHWEGIMPQCCNAKAAGATEEEIMEVAHIACYAVSKDKLVNTCRSLEDAFNSPSFINTKSLS